MSESISARVGRLVSGSINALVDAVENAAPEVVMEQAIREIDEAIDEVRAELGRVIASKHLANTRLMQENNKHDDLAEKIQLAVKQGRDDLAEAAIAQQLDIEAQIPVLENTIGEASAQEKELEGYINALQAKKREMRKELQEFSEARRSIPATAAGGDTATRNAGVEAKVGKAGEAFERVMHKQMGVGSGTGARDRTSAAQLAELEELSHQNRIRERLAAAKAGAED